MQREQNVLLAVYRVERWPVEHRLRRWMACPIQEKLVIAVASSVLVDRTESNAVFVEKGIADITARYNNVVKRADVEKG